MPVFTRHEIDTMGFKAARDFKEGSSLHTSIVKMAKDNSMNPEQIKRLVESANTTAFLNEFKGKDGNQRMVEFDVADPSKVINEAIGGPNDSNADSSGPSVSITITVDKDTSGLHDTIVNENVDQATVPNEKVASYAELSIVKLASEEDNSLSLSPYNKYQAKDSLLTKLADCNYRASDIANELALRYRGIYTRDKYASFELDALSTYGNSALPALQMVRSRLNRAKIATSLSPQQEYYLHDRHIVEDSSELKKVASIINICEIHKKLSDSLAYLKSV